MLAHYPIIFHLLSFRVTFIHTRSINWLIFIQSFSSVENLDRVRSAAPTNGTCLKLFNERQHLVDKTALIELKI